VFYDKLDGYVIKLGRKEKNDSVIHDIVLFEKNYSLQDNMLFAESGIMRVTKDKKIFRVYFKKWMAFRREGRERYTQNRIYTTWF